MPTTRRSKSSFTWFWSRILYRIFRFALRRLSKSSGACANRFTHEFRLGHLSVEVVTRDLLRPEGYSREELVSMLALVREHEVKMGWHVPEEPGQQAPRNVVDFPKTLLPVSDAAHLLRALARAQGHLETLASERLSPTFHPEHAILDALLLGVGLRVARLAGGVDNPALLEAWRSDNKTLTVDTSWGRGDDEQALGRLVRNDGTPVSVTSGSGAVCLTCGRIKLSSSHECSSDKVTGTALPPDTLAYQSTDRSARFLETHPLENPTIDQLRDAFAKRRALIQQNRCPQCRLQMIGHPRGCPVHGEPS